GLDAVSRQRFYDHLLADVAEHPRTVLLSTHLIDEVAGLLQHVAVIDRGRIVRQGDADALRSHAVVLTGPAADVGALAAAARRDAPAVRELSREHLAGTLRLVLDRGADASATPA